MFFLPPSGFTLLPPSPEGGAYIKIHIINYWLFCELEGGFEMGLLSGALSHSLKGHKSNNKEEKILKKRIYV